MAALDSWPLVGTVLGLAASAGVNLYLTTLIVGAAIRLGWVSNLPPDLALLGENWALAISGVFFLLEFCADKVPWVDSLWDAVHTAIRPVGGALLALGAVGTLPPAVQLMAALLAGGVALSTHTTKASTRVLVNHSPEPVSNVALSLGEDAAVFTFSWLTLLFPLVAFALVVLFLVLFAWFAPKAFRLLRRSLGAVWRRLAGAPSAPAGPIQGS